MSTQGRRSDCEKKIDWTSGPVVEPIILQKTRLWFPRWGKRRRGARRRAQRRRRGLGTSFVSFEPLSGQCEVDIGAFPRYCEQLSPLSLLSHYIFFNSFLLLFPSFLFPSYTVPRHPLFRSPLYRPHSLPFFIRQPRSLFSLFIPLLLSSPPPHSFESSSKKSAGGVKVKVPTAEELLWSRRFQISERSRGTHRYVLTASAHHAVVSCCCRHPPLQSINYMWEIKGKLMYETIPMYT